MSSSITLANTAKGFTKEELDEIKYSLENSLNYYKDLLDDAPLDPEEKKKKIQDARCRT
jgi:hypothetical protein